MGDLLLRDGILADGSRVDIAIADSVISSVDPTGTAGGDTAEVVDLEGRLVLGAFGEPHAHLDKAFLADVLLNPAGDLDGAVHVMRSNWHRVPIDDVVERAERAVRKLVASGTTAIRTHADTTPEGGLKSVEALVEVRRRVAGLADMQVVTMAYPVSGPDGDVSRNQLEQGIALGTDLVGGAPHLEDDPSMAMAVALETAAAGGVAVDLHMDEVLDAGVQYLEELARLTEAAGLGGRVTASHCVSHGLLPPEEQREVGRALADAGVGLVTLPRTNLYLQARGIQTAPPRGLAGVRALLDTGVTVAAGADNVQDPFYVIGKCDALETASLLISTAHLGVDEAAELIGPGTRRVLGLPAAEVAPGSPAELVAIAAASVREAIAEQPEDRIVVHAGRVVARTTVDSWVATA